MSGLPGRVFKFSDPSKAYALAKRYIRNNAKRRKQKKIDLSGLGLTEIPNDICDLDVIEEIDLSNNKIEFIPECFGNIESLRGLDISGNAIREMPDSFSKLSRLSYLVARENNFHELPIQFLELESLRYLDVDNSNIKAFPKAVRRNPSITMLYARNNQLEALPDYFDKFTSLRTVNFYQNKISELPQALFTLGDLEHFELAYNRLHEIPDAISNLQSLQSLNVAFNSLTEINKSVFDLLNLETLFISGNPINKIDPAIGNLKKLRVLSAAQCRLYSLPEELYHLKDMEMLVFETNMLEEISPSISNLHKLEYLTFANNKIQSIPHELGNLESLMPASSGNGGFIPRLFFNRNPLPAPYDLIGNLDEPTKTKTFLAFARGELDLSYFDDLKNTAELNGAAIEPSLPDLEAGPAFRVADGKLDLIRNRLDLNDIEDRLQEGLRKRLTKQVEKLNDACKKVGNIYPDLVNTVDEYRSIISESPSELDVVGLWAVGNSLVAQAISFEGQNVNRTITEPLEPTHRALLIDVARLHGSYVLGFAEGRTLSDRADLVRVSPDDLVQIEGPTKLILRDLTGKDDLASVKARKLVKSLEDALQVVGWGAARVGHTSYVTLRNLLIETGRIVSLVNEKGGGALGAIALAHYGVDASTVTAISNFLIENTQQILSFAEPFPEMLSYMTWTLNHIGHEKLDDK